MKLSSTAAADLFVPRGQDKSLLSGSASSSYTLPPGLDKPTFSQQHKEFYMGTPEWKGYITIMLKKKNSLTKIGELNNTTWMKLHTMPT